MFKKILVGYDGSKGGKAALRRAAVLAKGFNADLCALWVRELLPRHSDLPGEFESRGGSGGRNTSRNVRGKSKRWRLNTEFPSAAKRAAAMRPKPFCASPTKGAAT